MDKHCRICHNISCSNHGKNVSFLGDGWKCNYIPVPTNADRIRAMSDEDLAAKISHSSDPGLCDIICGGNCKAFTTFNKTSEQRCAEIVLDWLQQPAKGE